MKILVIIVQVALLYLFYMVGDYLQKLLHLPVPGSIVGLILLFILLIFRIVPVKWIENGSITILSYLPLFFIPATAGIVNHLDIFNGRGLVLILILIVSTILTMVTAAHSSQWLEGWSSSRSVRSSIKEKGKEL
ncbi:CidA/LrgA family protein [Paenibacillus monticola]|uniref:CidA/LrgA family holin-like protein n=1 Tax=Paenibacillus monticola TaxID=2666075 RepID=A0A7X2L110_9BACL|nr:CidA/LrgA family holin-like protein [Paenibacillus monticola]MRN52688.1 CidA/LrgA family holin-like protein [Paenibacillus monticola]